VPSHLENLEKSGKFELRSGKSEGQCAVCHCSVCIVMDTKETERLVISVEMHEIALPTDKTEVLVAL